MDIQENNRAQILGNEPETNDITEENSTKTDDEKTDGQEKVTQEKSEEKQIKNVQEGTEWDKMSRVIQNNKGNINIYFQNREYFTNNGVITGDGAQFQNVSFGKQQNQPAERTENNYVEDSEKLQNWMSKNCNNIGFSYLIACAVFHSMPYIWISEVAEELNLILNTTEEIKEIFVQKRITEFGAEIYKDTIVSNMGKSELDFVRFERVDYPEIILKCIWNGFPQFRENIINWLKNCILHKRNSMFQRANLVISVLAQEDYYYFAHKITKQLVSEKNSNMDIALAQIILEIDENENFKRNVEILLNNWCGQKDPHRLLTVMLSSLGRADKKSYLTKAINLFLKQILNCFHKNIENEFSQHIFEFFAAGMRSFTFYRIMLDKVYEFSRDSKLRDEVCNIFLILFFSDRLLACSEGQCFEEAIYIKLAYTKNDIRPKLCKLWQMVWRTSKFRPIFYAELGEYFVQLDQSIREQKIKQFVYAAFSEICTEEYTSDIITKINIKCRRIEKNERIYNK